MPGRLHLLSLSPETLRSRKTRVIGGVALIVHGLAHAVIPLRGAGRFAQSVTAQVVTESMWTIAMLGFVSAGLGLLGASPLRKFRRTLVISAVAASVIALGAFRQIDLWPGAIIDTLVLVAFYRTGSQALPAKRWTGILPNWKRPADIAGSIAAVLLVAYLTVCATTRSRHHRWGASDEELSAPLPGDAPDRDPAFEVNHAVTIDAPPPSVWPWLVQIGQDRAGFYSYDWLENLFGLRIHNADRVHPEWQHRSPGDLVRAAPADWAFGLFGEDVGWLITHVEPHRAIVLRWWGAFVLTPLPQGKTRLVVRSKVSDFDVPVWAAAFSFTTFELPHFIMERQMLLTIKDRAERTRRLDPQASPDHAVASP